MANHDFSLLPIRLSDAAADQCGHRPANEFRAGLTIAGQFDPRSHLVAGPADRGGHNPVVVGTAIVRAQAEVEHRGQCGNVCGTGGDRVTQIAAL